VFVVGCGKPKPKTIVNTKWSFSDKSLIKGSHYADLSVSANDTSFFVPTTEDCYIWNDYVFVDSFPDLSGLKEGMTSFKVFNILGKATQQSLWTGTFNYMNTSKRFVDCFWALIKQENNHFKLLRIVVSFSKTYQNTDNVLDKTPLIKEKDEGWWIADEIEISKGVQKDLHGKEVKLTVQEESNEKP
jgi:hypothetical protein